MHIGEHGGDGAAEGDQYVHLSDESMTVCNQAATALMLWNGEVGTK